MKRHFLVDFGLEVKKWKKVREIPAQNAKNAGNAKL